MFTWDSDVNNKYLTAKKHDPGVIFKFTKGQNVKVGKGSCCGGALSTPSLKLGESIACVAAVDINSVVAAF